jgi:hypothetical protein
VTDEGVLDKEVTQNKLARYNRESQHAKEYVAPPNDVLCEGHKRTLREMFTGIFKEMKNTDMTAIVIK